MVKTRSLSHLGSDRYQDVTDRHQDRIAIANRRYMIALAHKKNLSLLGCSHCYQRIERTVLLKLLLDDVSTCWGRLRCEHRVLVMWHRWRATDSTADTSRKSGTTGRLLLPAQTVDSQTTSRHDGRSSADSGRGGRWWAQLHRLWLWRQWWGRAHLLLLLLLLMIVNPVLILQLNNQFVIRLVKWLVNQSINK